MKIEVCLSTKMFRRFSFFDTFRRLKAWRRPVIFMLIMFFFSAICFMLHEREDAILLGSILASIGLVLPLVYVMSFLSSVNEQAAKYGLVGLKHVYTLEMNPNSKMFTVDNGKERVNVKWQNIFCIYRDTVAAYLYVSPKQAFILPYSCMENPTETFWPMVKNMIPAEKIIDLR